MTTMDELREIVANLGRRVDAFIAENAARSAELEAKAAAQTAELKASIEEERKKTEASQRKTEAVVRKIANDFHSQWGRLVESLVKNQLLPLLREQGIPVMDTSKRRTGHYKGKEFEIDIIAHDGDKVVLVEVKTTLRPDDVEWFVEKLGYARDSLSECYNRRVIGAVAFLHEAAHAAKFAQSKGLFTIVATGNGAVVTNPKPFTPKEW
ncbi:MAG: DUF234 domain-containing protein [Thermoguttaceae bacterium]